MSFGLRKINAPAKASALDDRAAAAHVDIAGILANNRSGLCNRLQNRSSAVGRGRCYRQGGSIRHKP
jgi:hypothetical protein